jgi:hypothetical protein
MLASKSDFTTPQLDFYAKIDDHGIRQNNTGQILTQWRRPVASRVALDRGCTGEFSRAKAKKKIWFHIRKKNRSQKNVTKHNSCHPQKW